MPALLATRHQFVGMFRRSTLRRPARYGDLERLRVAGPRSRDAGIHRLVAILKPQLWREDGDVRQDHP
jgi:hypothetical protein